MARHKTLTVVFKQNHQNQGMLLPPDLNDLIGASHPVRTVSSIIDKVDLSSLIRKYKPGGTSSYDPRMLLKVLVYAYMNNIYSSRRIEEAVAQNICFMWLAGMTRPDHNTINRFRGERLDEELQPIFTEVVMLLCGEGLLSIRDLFTDGTKIESNANRYTFVWGNSIKTSKERIKTQLTELWQYAKSVAASELDDTDPSGFDKIDAEKVTQTVDTINAALKHKEVDKKVRQKLNYAKNKWPEALQKYEEQEKIMGEQRSSYSKTDTDATFMRMKEDHMRNGQLKPAYNVQISTNNQYIVTYSIHQQTTDINTLIDHLTTHRRQYRQQPSSVTADAGYGSEQNYEWLENRHITAYIKHNQFDRQQRKGMSGRKAFTIDKFTYDKQADQYECPLGMPLVNIGSRQRVTKNGFKQKATLYQATGCDKCPLRDECHEQKHDRIIEVNHNLNRLRQKAGKRLKSKKGIEKRKKRCYDVEPVFANLKNNHQFKRFMLRSKKKVSIEFGLLALAHNLRKKAA